MLDQLPYVRSLIEHERFKDAYTILSAIPNKTAFINWQLGIALNGMNHSQKAIAYLLKAYLELVGLDKTLCGLEIATLYNRSGHPNLASSYLDEAKISLNLLQNSDVLLVLQVIQVLSLQILGKNEVFLSCVEELTPKLMAHNKQSWLIILMIAASSYYIQTGNLDHAELIARQYLPLSIHLNLSYRTGLLYHQLARISYLRGKLQETHALLQTANYHMLLSGSEIGIGDVYQMQGVIYYEEGNFTIAKTYLTQAIQHYIFSDHLEFQAVCHFNLAILEIDIGNYQAGLTALQQAEDMVKPLGYSWVLANIHFATGKLHLQLNNVRYAKARLIEATQAFEHSQRHDWAAQSTALLYSVDANNPAQQYHWLQQSIAHLQHSQPNLYHELAALTLGEQLLANGDASSALAWLTQAMHWFDTANMLPEWGRSQLAWLECTLTLGQWQSDTPQMLEALRLKLGALPEFGLRIALLYAAYMQQQTNPAAALGHLQIAVKHINTLRQYANDLVLASRIAGRFEAVFGNALQLATTLNANDIVLALSEQRRALWLKQMMTGLQDTSSNPEFKKAPTQSAESDLESQRLIQEGHALRFAFTQVSSHPQHFNAEKLAALQARASTWQHQCDRFDARQMAVEHPLAGRKNSFSQPLQTQPEIIAAFCARFGQHWTAIAFEPLSAGVHPLNPSYVMLMLTPTQFEHQILHLTKIQQAMLAHLTDPSDDRRKNAYHSQHPAASKIAQLLHIDDWLTASSSNSNPSDHTLIIAHSQAWDLDFAALPMRDGSYLGQHSLIRHVPSWAWAAQQCAEWQSSNAITPTPIARVLSIAPITFDGRHPALPHSLTEIQTCRQYFPHVRTLHGPEASITTLFALSQSGELASYDLIHFASHACLLPDQPRFSAIALADGELTLQGMLNLHLQARLVVVSACQTGLNVSYGGEERIGIETALLSAGAGTTLSALWSMGDNIAATLMLSTLHHLANTADMGRALTHAQRTRQTNYAPMSAWAGWRVSGIG